jgi:hypothetical protein
MKLYKAFLNGIIQLGISEEEIKKWHYCGGRKFTTSDDGFECHEKYYRLCCPQKEFLEQIQWCVCGHAIINNGYIYNENREWDSIIRIGSCCIKQFMSNGMRRTCETCNLIHQNRLVNKCNICRYKCCGFPVKKDEKCTVCKKKEYEMSMIVYYKVRESCYVCGNVYIIGNDCRCELKKKQQRIEEKQIEGQLLKLHLEQERLRQLERERLLALKNVFCEECDGSEMSYLYKMCPHCCCLKCENPNYKCVCTEIEQNKKFCAPYVW